MASGPTPAGPSWAPQPGGSCRRLSVWDVFACAEPGKDQSGERFQSRLGIGPARFQVKLSPTVGGQKRQVEDTLAVNLFPIMKDADFRLKLAGQFRELEGRPHVQAFFIGNFDVSSCDRRVVTHRDSVGQEARGQGWELGGSQDSDRLSRLVSINLNLASDRDIPSCQLGKMQALTILRLVLLKFKPLRPGTDLPKGGASVSALIGLVKDFNDLFAALRLPQKSDETFVLEVSRDVFEGPQMISRLIRGRNQ